MTVQANKYNGHTYVDFGLPSGTKWATMNIGASSEMDYGNYYQYGKGASQFAATYQTQNDYAGTESPLSMSYDTARQVWGGQWHMPTQSQCQELIDNCTWTYTTINGVYGCSASKNGKSIFFPAAGYWQTSGTKRKEGYICNYWSSTPFPDRDNMAYFVQPSSSPTVSGNLRSYGFPVRGVVDS